MATPQEIFNEMSNHINNSGENGSSWYVGISSNVKDALFKRHKVNENTGKYIGRYTDTDKNARAIEEALIKKHGTKGGGGGGDSSTKGIYAYVITNSTSED